MSGKTPRRKILISSDEEDEEMVSKHMSNSFAISDQSKSSISEGRFEESILSGSIPNQSDASLISFASSTPLIKVNRSKDLQRTESSKPSSSFSSFEDIGEHDRSRSFRETRLSEEPMSPVSARLMQMNDPASKQKLRERLLKKNMMKQKAENTDIVTLPPPLRLALSPVVKSSQSTSSQMSVEEQHLSNSDEDDVFSTEVVDNSNKTIEPKYKTEENSFLEYEQSEQKVSSIKSTSSVKSASIICISDSDDEENNADIIADIGKTYDDILKDVSNSVKELLKNTVQELEQKKATTQKILDRLPAYELKDGGQKVFQKMQDIEKAISLKKIQRHTDKNTRAEGNDDIQIIHHQQREPTIPPPQFDPTVYSRLLAPDKKRLFGGKMTDNRWNTIRNITEKCLKGMHDAIDSMPDDSQVLETPAGINVELMPHQKQGIAWMVWRESQSAPGGILADDMGLGKTLSTIALVVHQKNERLKRKEENKDSYDLKRYEVVKKMGLVPSNTTLVVAPASVIYQWEAEIKNRVKPNKLLVYVFHGPKNKREDNPKRLARYDIIITTYALVSTELTERIKTQNNEEEPRSESDEEQPDKAKKHIRRVMNTDSVLAKVAFERVILDEAHAIKNKTTSASKAVCRLAARNHWCLSGTPIHNNLWDLYSLVRFIRVSPFDDESHWKEYIMASSSKASDRLNLLTKNLLLRRTKAQTCAITKKPLVDLKPKVMKEYNLTLGGVEKDIYDIMFRATQLTVEKLLKDDEEDMDLIRRPKKKSEDVIKNPFIYGMRTITDRSGIISHMLVLLLRLRQACVHMHLTKEAIDMAAFEDLGGDSSSADDFLERTMAELSLSEDKLAATAVLPEEVFKPYYLSTKIKKVMEIVKEVVDSGEKIVVVSQWTSVLSIIGQHLKNNAIKSTSITGEVAVADRQECVDSFNTEGGDTQVMLLSLTAGGVGLNLIGGNHLIMVDLHWNPALEAQACDRIYRMGQKKTVYIHRVVTSGTIEQRVVELQERKLQLAGQVLDGAASKKMQKLTLQDVRYLFDLDVKKVGKKPTNQ